MQQPEATRLALREAAVDDAAAFRDFMCEKAFWTALPIDPPTGASQPLVASSKDDHKQWIDVQSFNEPAGVHIAMGDVDDDGILDLVVGVACLHLAGRCHDL